MEKVTAFKHCERFFFLCATLFLFLSCEKKSENFRSSLDLSGCWQFALDSAGFGIQHNWFSKELSDSIQLPGTTDLSQKGYKNKDTTTLHLNRVFVYEGPAWYKKKIIVPEEWQNRHVQLVMERTKPSKIWVDDHYIGESFLLESPQKYDLSQFLSPGEHTITIRIDNSLELTPFGNVHIYTDDTQTNWNGIIGDFYLEASDKMYINDVQVYPDVDNKKIKVRVAIDNQMDIDNLTAELSITKLLDGKKTTLEPAYFSLPYDSVIVLEYTLGQNMDLWDEYHQPLYELNVVISNAEKSIQDNLATTFGMRKFDDRGTQFTINGRTTFLRGKNDACVFPLTGHPPMDKAEWARLFNIAKSYGINHYRFHSWCPPEAAFAAADQVGIYLQPEMPFWGGLESDTVAEMLKAEGIALLRSYANHPSFVMFSPGNEIWSGHDRVKKMMTELKELDDRPLYTQGSNNSIGYVGPMEFADFHLAARTPFAHDTILTHTRLTHAYADSKDGGMLNMLQPATTATFDYSVSQIDIPLVSHEIGQYQIYPDYVEIDKYTGVVRAWNLEVFRERLEKSGMLDQNTDFTKSSGAWAALCYKAEMEAAFRTKGFGGFQLLDLQDFPGQGTALVGILDAFMDSKNVISREEWLRSCNDVVILLSFKKYVWTNAENFKASVEVANYADSEMMEKLQWEITDSNGKLIKKSIFNEISIPQGKLTTLGEIEISLADLKVPQKLLINLSLENTDYNNSYPIWIYPQPQHRDSVSHDILITSRLNSDIVNKLNTGKKVLLMPEVNSVKENTIGGLFPPEFWNYGMFKGISEWAKKPVSPGTLGILTDPKHPLFDSFPTDFHTNWQWWLIIRNSTPLILDKTQKEYRPVVQVIDNLERNHKLGLVFEFKVGEGKLLVCMSQLDKIRDRPEAAQFYSSIINYMKSEKFDPAYDIDEGLLKQLLR